MDKVLLSSERQDWGTPPEILETIKVHLGAIDYDPASQEGNPTGAYAWSYQDDEFRGYTSFGEGEHHAARCGLVTNWGPGLVFCNPPYGRQLGGKLDPDKLLCRRKKFAEGNEYREVYAKGAGWAEKMAQYRGEGLYLVPTRTDAAWFRKLHHWADVRVDLAKRLKFGGHKDSAPFPNTLLYLGPREDEFLEGFANMGTVLRKVA